MTVKRLVVSTLVAVLAGGCSAERKVESTTASAPSTGTTAAKDTPTAAPSAAATPAPAAPAPADTATTPPPAGDAEPEAPPPLRFANTTHTQDEILSGLRDSPVERLRVLGNSSVVLRADLGVDFDAALKPSTKKRARAYAAEVASYRLARLLGLDNVPPAVTRNLDPELMRERLSPASAWTEVRDALAAETGPIPGAAIYWIEDLTKSELDTRRGIPRYAQWLAQGGTLSDADRTLARDVSTMIAFDCVIGNWDRWSGGNVKGDAARQRLYIRDHDVAFAGRLSEELQRRLFDRLIPVTRFSASFVAALRQLSPERFVTELAQDPAGASLLDGRQISSMLDRRDAVLSHIDALIAEHGRDAVLYFP